jgi:hypothetical protein
MQSQLTLRARPLRAAAGVLAVSTAVVPAVALAADSAPRADGGPVPMKLHDRHLGYAQTVVADGRLPRTDGGRRVVLEQSPGGASWRAIGSARVHSDGLYRIRASAHHSGRVRARLVAVSAPRSSSTGTARAARSSHAQSIAVTARVAASQRGIAVLRGRSARVGGALLPRRAGRIVVLEVARHGRWSALARGRTNRNGHYSIGVRARGLGSSAMRVRFAGDRLNAPAAARSGRLDVFRVGGASWYQMTGSPLGCGGRMGAHQLGVANKTLPCGTRVTLRYRGRSITVPVIDRGPYVGGRDWDLSGETARRLHFGGTGQVWSTR